MLKTCEICGKRFTAYRSSARYCGERCRRTAKNEAQRKARAEAKRANARRSSKPATTKATDVYTPDDAARARADVINEFRRLTAARSY